MIASLRAARRAGLAAFAVLTASLFTLPALAQVMPPDAGAFETGEYRNLFAEAGIAQADIDARLARMWRFYFQNEDADQRLYWQSAMDEGYVVDINNRDIRSEGMSYAMMLAVQLDQKPVFDSLWRFAYRKMLVKEGPREGYFCWHVDPSTEKCLSEGPAPDGEEYFAMALYFADHLWGSGGGELDYRAHADEILREMLHQEDDNGGVRQGVTNMIHNEANQIVFVPTDWSDFTDPSYHLPHFYHLFSLWGPPEDRARWAQVRDVSRDYLANIRTLQPDTCLMPDYANFDGTPRATEFNRDAKHFKVDAWRTVFNWSLDHAWFAADERQKELSNCLLGFFREEGGRDLSYRSSYRLDGKPLRGAGPADAGLVAMNATGVLAVETDEAWPYDFVRALWETPLPEGQYRYYSGMLVMLGTLAAAGEYRIIGPDAASTDSDIKTE